MRVIISCKDDEEIPKLIIECKYFEIMKREAIVGCGEDFEGTVFKILIPEGLSEKIEKWMFINGKYDFSKFKTYMSNKEKTKWLCIYDPEEEK